MRSFNRIFMAVIVIMVLVFTGVNLYLSTMKISENGRPYRVEINRLVTEIEKSGLESVDISELSYVTNITINSDNSDFYEGTDSDYIIKNIGGKSYRFDYSNVSNEDNSRVIITVNVILGIVSIMVFALIIYTRRQILKPFEKLKEVPYELSRGNLTVPLKENKNRFFGRFVWGVDLLRENITAQKQRELELQKDKKTLLLSISHDIKTPLSAIKLYSKALSKGLYKDSKKQHEIAESINAKADEIEGFVSQIIKASSEDFLDLQVEDSEFYLSHLVEKIHVYYAEKLELINTEFKLEKYGDCILKGDLDRGVEVLQNVMENSIKYGDGHSIEISFADEENCIIISVKNSGCTLNNTELPHIFDSFWRGSNAPNVAGSGLGLYICRQLMRKMGGEIFAECLGDYIGVSVVFTKA